MEGSPRYSCRANRSLRSSGTGIGFTIARYQTFEIKIQREVCTKGIILVDTGYFIRFIRVLYTCLVDNTNRSVSEDGKSWDRQQLFNFSNSNMYMNIFDTKNFLKKSLHVYIRDLDFAISLCFVIEFVMNLIDKLFFSFSHVFLLMKFEFASVICTR